MCKKYKTIICKSVKEKQLKWLFQQNSICHLTFSYSGVIMLSILYTNYSYFAHCNS